GRRRRTSRRRGRALEMSERNNTPGSFPAAISSPGDALRLAMEACSIVHWRRKPPERRLRHFVNDFPAFSLKSVGLG
ncbi:MAG TPA: hypothetical protein VII11_00970, partial [Bacteroidota bacterium]